MSETLIGNGMSARTFSNLPNRFVKIAFVIDPH
jgi:hypothetical protein